MDQNTRTLENQVRNLTANLSLANSSSNDFLSLSMIPSTSSTPDATILLNRIHEMEERQQWMEGLIGGTGGTNAELEEVRAKRLVLEERQLLLEEELKQWKRRLKTEISEPSPDSRKMEKVIVEEVCTRCEEWMEEKKRIESLQRELNEKQEDTEMERALIESEKSYLEKEKQDHEEYHKKLTEENERLRALVMEEQRKNRLNNTCLRCKKVSNIEKLEETLCKNLNELAVERANVEGEKAWIECTKEELEGSLSDLSVQCKSIETAKRDIENQKKAIDQERQQHLTATNLTVTNLRQRELLMVKKTQELHELSRKLEKKQQEQANERDEIEQQWEQLLLVQKTLDKQKTDLEKERGDFLRMGERIEEREKELSSEREKLTIENVKLMREKEVLKRRESEVEANFNLLEMQMVALSDAQHSSFSHNTNRMQHRETDIWRN